MPGVHLLWVSRAESTCALSCLMAFIISSLAPAEDPEDPEDPEDDPDGDCGMSMRNESRTKTPLHSGVQQLENIKVQMHLKTRNMAMCT